MAVYHMREPLQGAIIIKQLRMQMYSSLAMLALLIIVCIVGLVVLDDATKPLGDRIFNAVWDTVNLISTLGSFSDFSNHQKGFMIGLIAAMAVLGAVSLSNLTSALTSQDAAKFRENRRMEKKLNAQSGHLVIVDDGQLGTVLASNILANWTSQVVLITPNTELALQAANDRYLVIQGTHEQIDKALAKSNIELAHTLLITPTNENHALAITMRAKQKNPNIRVIVSMLSGEKKDLLFKAGATEVLVAPEVMSERLARSLAITTENDKNQINQTT